MKDRSEKRLSGISQVLNRVNLKLRPKLILIFLLVKVIPIILLTMIALSQISTLGQLLREIAVQDSTNALNDTARENIERMTTDTARAIAVFLEQRDKDIEYLSKLLPSDEAYRVFSESKQRKIMRQGEWALAEDGMSWVEKNPYVYAGTYDLSENEENNDELFGSSFNYRPPDVFTHIDIPLYDEITFIGLDGKETYKYVNPNSNKINYPLNPNKMDVSDKSNTYVKAESYYDELKNLNPGDIYVSDVIGAYVGTNYVGMYTPGVLKNNVPATHPNYERLSEIANLPEGLFIEEAKKQAYAGKENPFGQRFEGIVRWAAPVTDDAGGVIGYVTMALNHDHIMEFVDYITPMQERYTALPDAYLGNYAFIWDYKCRSIAHPRHHSIVGYNPLTGEPQVPWLEGTQKLERDYIDGGFLKEEFEPGRFRTIPIPDEEGRPQLADDTPFYLWYTDGGAEWLEANKSWNDLSEESAGKSWGEFLGENEANRDILPQFGERVLLDPDGNPVTDETGKAIRDYQSRDKTPALALTGAGFVGLDGRYLNNAPQCTGWMNLTEHGGSGSFYILWSGLYKLTTAGSIPYYTGQYSPQVQGNQRGFAMVTIGAGFEDFTAPAEETRIKISSEIDKNMVRNTATLVFISLFLFVIVVLMALLLSSYLTDNIEMLIGGISRFRSGERQFRLHSNLNDEFGTLADSFDDMADSIVESENAPLSIIDMDHKIIYMNEHSLNVLNKTLDETVGLSYDDISFYPHGSKYDPLEAFHNGMETEAMHDEETGHYFKGSASYLTDHYGNKTGYIIKTIDVTEIEVARNNAVQASLAKSNFLANMSHEIRTPMNAIIGMASIAADSSDVEKKDYAIEKIQGASKHLLGVINDVLDMSKIEANKFNLLSAEFDFEKMLRQVVDVINFRVEEKKQKLTAHLDSSIPRMLLGDDQRFAQVITNLLTNAVKFTGEEGAIHLEVMLMAEENGIFTILTEVSDNGIGISDDQMHRLFSAFEQAEATTTRKYGGTGLGLVISKSIVEMMDGNIWVESELGKGSKFSFTARLAGCKTERKRMLAAEMKLENVRVLAVDDDPDVLSFFSDAAANIGIVCDLAKSGQEALSVIETKGAYNFYFVDWDMPGMNGIELARVISEKRDDNTIIIMISSHDWSVIQNDALEAGITKFIPKPLFSSIIADCINECLGVADSEACDDEEPTICFEGHSILLAEDVDINREIVSALLEPTCLDIDFAENGKEAVDMFLANPLKYDMIYMDLQMPEMDGYTATRNIRASDAPNAKKIPIVAMTANVFREDVERCLDAGMNDHLGKPLSFDDLLGQLQKYLSRKESFRGSD